MGLLFRKAGILTTMQDLGRFGYRRFGVNPGGVMDRTAARVINVLLGNAESEAVIEMHFPAAEIEFSKACTFAIGGAEFSAQLDGEEIENWRAYRAEAGSILRFTAKTLGNRAYLAIAGGFASTKWLGSWSTNLAAGIGGLDGRKLRNGDIVEFNIQPQAGSRAEGRSISPSLIPRYGGFPTVRAIAGAEFGKLDKQSSSIFETHNFAIAAESNRMGFRLAGEKMSMKKPFEILSSAVGFGTVQLLPDGQLIVLMADHQTTGGYPRIAHVIERDLPVLAQLGAGDKVAFKIIELADAEKLNSRFERDMALFRVGCGARP